MNAGKTRAQHATALPYPQPDWPTTSAEIEAAILALLIPLLTPIGEYRKETGNVSRGRKRHKRRQSKSNVPFKKADAGAKPQPPPISAHITIGLGSTYRKLEAQTQQEQDQSKVGSHRAIAIVFVHRNALPDPVAVSLPLLVAAASAKGSPDAIRLVPTTEQGELSIASALELPRAGLLAIDEAAPGCKGLFEYIRDAFAPIEVPWLGAVSSPTYLPLKLETSEIHVTDKATRAQSADKSRKPVKRKAAAA